LRYAIWYGLTGAVFVLGFSALMLVIKGKLVLAGQVILAATIFAGLEYAFRRKSAGAAEHVDEFSTLCDLLCFSVAPAFLLYRLIFHHWGILGLGAIFIVVFSGVLRLSLNKIYNPLDGKRHFIGIPLTVTAAFIALLAQWVITGELTPSFRLGLLALVTVLAFLTVSTIRYPNPAANPWFSALLAPVVAAVCWGPPVAEPAVWIMLGGGAVFVMFASLTVKKRR